MRSKNSARADRFLPGTAHLQSKESQYTGALSGDAPCSALTTHHLSKSAPESMSFVRRLHLAFATMLLLLSAGTVHAADDVASITQLFRSGQQTEAFTQIDALLATKSDRPDLRMLKGVLLVDVRRTDEALVVFQQLTEDFPEVPEPYNNLAVLYAARGDFDRARLALEGALRANPGFATAHQNLGDVYAQLAQLAYQRALKADPTNTDIPPRLSLLRKLTDPAARPSTP
jgi:tetratricopeptide (TPR) repeat protein